MDDDVYIIEALYSINLFDVLTAFWQAATATIAFYVLLRMRYWLYEFLSE